MPAPRLLTKLSYILFLVAFCLLASASAFAQTANIKQAVDLSKSAMEDYDFLELESADMKLIQAVQIIENLGITEPSIANIYIAQGIVSYGRFKDSAPAIADERAFSAFLKALTLNNVATIPSDYRSPEVDAIFSRAKETINSAPSSSGIVIATAKPSIQHTGISINDRCNAMEIRANVPAHPDIYRVYVYYAPDDQRGYTTLEMLPTIESSDILTATIPGYATKGDRVQYYIEAQNRLGEVVANVATAQMPLTTEMAGSCVGLSKEDLAQTYGEPLFQLSLLFGTGLGIVKGEVTNSLTNGENGPKVKVDTGVASMPFHMRAGLLFNLPAHFQVGVYVRGQFVNIVSATINKSINKDIKPEIYNVMVGATVRYLALYSQPYRLYVGLEVGWGGANASVNLGSKYNDFIDLYLYDGPIHIAPEIGFLWTFHKNIGLAVELAVPIHFPNKPSAHFDLSVGPYFQF